jgi:hypothetical protein
MTWSATDDTASRRDDAPDALRREDPTARQDRFETEELSTARIGLSWNAALETGGVLIGDEVKVSVTVQGVGQ